MQCSNARLLSSDGSGHLRVVNKWEQSSLSNFDASSGNLQCCKRVNAVNNCSFFHIQLSISHFHPQSVVISIGKVRVFMGHNAAGFPWTRKIYLPLRPDSVEQVILLKRRTFKASFFSRT